jgi:hypothetical protein
MMKAPVVAALLVAAFQAHAQIAPQQPPRAVPQRPSAVPERPTVTPQADQPAPGVPLPLQVQRIAPQLVAFAGSQANFDNLVNGLAGGSPVTLTTVEPSGATQTVTFTPAAGAATSPAEIARTLEATRQQLIATGVATPTAQQLGSTLAGTSVPVTLGTPVAVPGATAPGTPSATPGTGLVPGAAAAGGSLPSAAEQIQSRPAAPRVNTSDNPAAGNLSDTPVPANQPAPGPAIAPRALEGTAPAPAQPGVRLDR